MEQYLHKVMLRKLEFGRDRKGLGLCTKGRRRLPPLIYHYCAIFCCFLIKSKCNHNLVVDRISELPEDVLARIVSLLPLKEAVATSVLSRRWRYAWTFTTNLDFGAVKELFQFVDLKRKLQDQESRRYVHWVNRSLENHSGSDIRNFKVCFDLNNRFASSIDRWVELALNKRVEVLELDFVKLSNYNFFKRKYSFPSKLLGLEKSSTINNCIGLKSLKVLYLQRVDVTEELFDYFLSHCSVLERFTVISAESLPNVRVVGPSLRLKYLELRTCGLRRVEIRDTNLVSFIHRSLYSVDLNLNNVPFLEQVYVFAGRGNFMSSTFTQLSCCLSQLETLHCNIQGVSENLFNEDRVLPIMENLKTLELYIRSNYKWSLSLISSFMKASPSLQRLVLKQMFWDKEEKKIRKAAKCPHSNLKVVEVVGYRGSSNFDQHVIYLIENAVELEKLVIDPVRRFVYHHTGAGRGKRHLKEEATARSQAMQRLKAKVPSTIEFVCL